MRTQLHRDGGLQDGTRVSWDALNRRAVDHWAARSATRRSLYGDL